jgi:hypothetical protein
MHAFTRNGIGSQTLELMKLPQTYLTFHSHVAGLARYR